MGSLRLNRIRSLRRKKQRRSSQSSSFRSNLASLANLEVLSPLSWGLQLGRQPSHFWRPSPSLARTILPRLARMVRNSLEKEIKIQDDIKEDSDFEIIPEVSEKTNIYPTLPSEEQTRLWKTNPRQPENKDGKETTEKMDSNTHTS